MLSKLFKLLILLIFIVFNKNILVHTRLYECALNSNSVGVGSFDVDDDDDDAFFVEDIPEINLYYVYGSFIVIFLFFSLSVFFFYIKKQLFSNIVLIFSLILLFIVSVFFMSIPLVNVYSSVFFGFFVVTIIFFAIRLFFKRNIVEFNTVVYGLFFILFCSNIIVGLGLLVDIVGLRCYLANFFEIFSVYILPTLNVIYAPEGVEYHALVRVPYSVEQICNCFILILNGCFFGKLAFTFNASNRKNLYLFSGFFFFFLQFILSLLILTPYFLKYSYILMGVMSCVYVVIVFRSMLTLVLLTIWFLILTVGFDPNVVLGLLCASAVISTLNVVYNFFIYYY
jgi:hypothetical protein